jgi:hypothetical protein
MAWHHRSNILYGPSHTSNPKTKNDKAYPKKVTLVLAPHYTLFAQSSTSHFSSKDDHSPQQHDVEANCRRLVAFQSKQGNHIDCCIDWGETIQRSIWNFFCCFTEEIEDNQLSFSSSSWPQSSWSRLIERAKVVTIDATKVVTIDATEVVKDKLCQRNKSCITDKLQSDAIKIVT